MTIAELEEWESKSAEEIRRICQGNVNTTFGRVMDIRNFFWRHRHHTWLTMTSTGLTDAAIEKFKKAPQPGQQSLDKPQSDLQ
jgi:hypothetical protein